MVSIMADFGAVSAAVPGAAPEPHETAPARWPLLPRLGSTAIGARLADGTTRVRRSEPAGCILYGPYLHLPEGSYRLSFRCRAGFGLRAAGLPAAWRVALSASAARPLPAERPCRRGCAALRPRTRSRRRNFRRQPMAARRAFEATVAVTRNLWNSPGTAGV